MIPPRCAARSTIAPECALDNFRERTSEQRNRRNFDQTTAAPTWKSIQYFMLLAAPRFGRSSAGAGERVGKDYIHTEELGFGRGRICTAKGSAQSCMIQRRRNTAAVLRGCGVKKLWTAGMDEICYTCLASRLVFPTRVTSSRSTRIRPYTGIRYGHVRVPSVLRTLVNGEQMIFEPSGEMFDCTVSSGTERDLPNGDQLMRLG
ncbi:hypothetical protein DFH06DRAFT_1131008 [Mycena polygramma]|nr:hypothetical protein DFH06DRAFT_1131008 [Mycena polygramma]